MTDKANCRRCGKEGEGRHTLICGECVSELPPAMIASVMDFENDLRDLSPAELVREINDAQNKLEEIEPWLEALVSWQAITNGIAERPANGSADHPQICGRSEALPSVEFEANATRLEPGDTFVLIPAEDISRPEGLAIIENIKAAFPPGVRVLMLSAGTRWGTLPAVVGVSRVGDNPQAVLMSFRGVPSDDALTMLHDLLGVRAQPSERVMQ